VVPDWKRIYESEENGCQDGTEKNPGKVA